MTSQVYYRKWRPRTFGELVGQDHVGTTIRQALKSDRVGHAYLLCGPRGTGKTTSARILAKSLNCLSPQDGEPCNSCGPCVAVDEGRFMDLIELDAASNRGIDEIRNIRERVHLSPSEGRYKVFIIDEAHMLTEFAANAFLKTLEEPPPHVIFALCTTEPHKILPTMISRCQRFDFRRLASKDVVKRLATICEGEDIEVDGEALQAIAQASEGSLRDAENLLEQLAMSTGGSRVALEDVKNLLGLGDTEEALELIGYTLAGNASAALATINRAVWESTDLRQLLKLSVGLLRGVLVLQWVSSGETRTVDFPQETIKALATLAAKSSKERVIKTLRLFGGVSLKHDSSSPLPLELAVVEACVDEEVQVSSATPTPSEKEKLQGSSHVGDRFAPQRTPYSPAKPLEHEGRPENMPKVPQSSATAPASPEVETPSENEVATAPASPEVETPSEDEVASSPASTEVETPSEGEVAPIPVSSDAKAHVTIAPEQWGTLIRGLSRYKGRRFNVGALLRSCKDRYLDGETLVLAFSHRSNLERMQQELDYPQSLKAINEAIAQSLGNSYHLRLTLDGNAKSSIISSPTESPLVRAAMGMGARILEEREL